MAPLVSIVIPARPHEHVVTLESLMAGTLQDFEAHVVVDKDLRGAPWARNRGAELARGEYLLFCDNDVVWAPDALEVMVKALVSAPSEIDGRVPGYAFGAYEIPGVGRFCTEEWSYDVLRWRNLCSTMSLIRRDLAIEWDEVLQRAQDWSYWLTLAERGVCGVRIPRVLFTTQRRLGITYGNPVSWEQAAAVVRAKHGIRAGEPSRPKGD